MSLITDLDGIEIRQGVFDYPPFTKTTRVVSAWPQVEYSAMSSR